MKFNLDTENCENIKLRLDRDTDVQSCVVDFAFGLSAFYTDFAMQLGLNEEQAMSLLEVVQSCMTRNVEEFINNGLLDLDDDDAHGVSKEDLDELAERMAEINMSEEEISNILNLVRDCGSIEAANDILMQVGEEAGIDWDKALH